MQVEDTVLIVPRRPTFCIEPFGRLAAITSPQIFTSLLHNGNQQPRIDLSDPRFAANFGTFLRIRAFVDRYSRAAHKSGLLCNKWSLERLDEEFVNRHSKRHRGSLTLHVCVARICLVVNTVKCVGDKRHVA